MVRKYLQDYRNNWIDLEKNVSSVVSKILHHIMMWIEPSWRLPSKSSHEWMSFSWLHQIEESLFPDEDDSAPSSETSEKKAWEFLQNLWDIVRKENLWQDPNLQSLVCENSIVFYSARYNCILTTNDIAVCTRIHSERRSGRK